MAGFGSFRIDHSADGQSKIAGLIYNRDISSGDLPSLQNDIHALIWRGHVLTQEDRIALTALQDTLQKHGMPDDIHIGMTIGNIANTPLLVMRADGKISGADTNGANIETARAKFAFAPAGVAVEQPQTPARSAAPAPAAPPAPAGAAPPVSPPPPARGPVAAAPAAPLPNAPVSHPKTGMTLGESVTAYRALQSGHDNDTGRGIFGWTLPWGITLHKRQPTSDEIIQNSLERLKEAGHPMNRDQLSKFAQEHYRIAHGPFKGDERAYLSFLEDLAKNPEYAGRDFNQLMRSGALMKAAQQKVSGQPVTLDPAPSAPPARSAALPATSDAPAPAGMAGVRSGNKVYYERTPAPPPPPAAPSSPPAGGGAQTHPVPQQGPAESRPLPPASPAPPVAPTAPARPAEMAVTGSGTEVKPFNQKTQLLQAYLKCMGIETGPLDGREGSKTRRGLEEYAARFPSGISPGGLKAMSVDDLLKHMQRRMLGSTELKDGQTLQKAMGKNTPEGLKSVQLVLSDLGFKGRDGKPLPTDGKHSSDLQKALGDYTERLKQGGPPANPGTQRMDTSAGGKPVITDASGQTPDAGFKAAAASPSVPERAPALAPQDQAPLLAAAAAGPVV